MLKTAGGVTTVYFQGLFEQTFGVSWKQYYQFNGQTVAVRDSVDGVSYLHGDHLGSVSVATDTSGALTSQQEFDPWGAVRGGNVPQTSMNYTGQRLDGTGLLYYHARMYDPVLGRFVSADSVVPGSAGGSMDGVQLKPLTVDFHEVGFVSSLNGENAQPFWFQMSGKQRQQAGSPWGPQNPQSLNRYSYVLNGPVRYTDPSGHQYACNAHVCGIPLGPGRGAGISVGGGAAAAGTGVVAGYALANKAETSDENEYEENSSVDRTLQTGGNTVKKSTADALNQAHGLDLSRREWGRTLEALKKDLGLANNHHGKIMESGDYVDADTGEVLGNLLDFLP